MRGDDIISHEVWSREVWDPLGQTQTGAMYELQAIAYARWIAKRDRRSLKRASGARCVWERGHITRVDFFECDRVDFFECDRAVSVAIPNPDPAGAHRVRNCSMQEVV